MDIVDTLREGQTVKVFQKIVDGKRERIVPFVGKLMKVRGEGVNKTITVKQNLEGVDVEKIFPVVSPTITKIEIVIVAEKKRKSKKSSKGKRK
ncbi:MAG TPA: 50S ribosomal protein L19 [Patescibacteria group bacterium]|nr:50S ribosomal protein L19 [Patescibacteria group bacterium]